ncbi:hypothetical protein [Epilithonimonas zeae]|uniref:hypothetical protein n=1 Tax=Epilithonimonas zeae TaxID=1416779 RepID=UPI00200BBDF7|nr:hypothetical protein [Epilithonimonas zeae]UQB67934.1 hypothetical protein KI430_12955 [Epilithonimonas zeae]
MGSWKYEIVHDYNATRLIKEFREENLKLKNSKGMDDDETDCIIYAEKDDHTISLGRVLLVKMSDAMINYYYEYKDPDYLPKYWAKYIYEENKNNKTFQFNEEEISNAFFKSIVLHRKLMSVTALELQNYLKKITENLSDYYRKDEKFSREQWDPTLKSDQYLFAKPELAINYFVKKSDSLKNRLTTFRKQLEHIKSFKIVGKEFKIQTIDDIIKGIDDNIKSIENFKKWMIGSRDDIKLNIAYFCGIYNGIVEFIAGFIDIGLLAINIVISDVLGGETNLEFLEIREAVEETLSKILQDPRKVFNDIIEAVKNYKYSRYDDPKLNQYQIQYNEGEDTVLATDIIIAIITIIKAIAKLAKLLPKFTKWIDAILGRNGRQFVKGRVAFGEITKAVLRKEIPEDFFEALKKMGKSEDDILEYYTKYHNENDYMFLNGIEDILKNNKNITKTDAFALWSYTTNHYYWDLNNWLRNGVNAAKTKEISLLLTKALYKMPKYNGTAFRALEFSDDSILQSFLKKHSKGNTVDYDDFVSCGSNTDAAFFDKPKKNVFLKMEVKNAPIISDFADGIKIRGYDKDELLLLRGRKFVIKEYKKVGDKHYFELIEK